ncbi:MAG: thiamine phosphate synthase [Spirochaetales bacterium]|nr:thiamine phosphate synthase [Spirochaetales bacterium]
MYKQSENNAVNELTAYIDRTICITNRELFNQYHQCHSDDDYLEHIRRIAATQPRAIILREKSSGDDFYYSIAGRVISICESNGVQCILHTFVDAAMKLNHRAIHLPMSILRQMTDEQRQFFTILGASCHSVEEAREAQLLGCTYITASHIFTTECKPDLAPRGLDFLSEVCRAVTIPVYALGGIHPHNAAAAIAAGASGVCMMSEFMKIK